MNLLELNQADLVPSRHYFIPDEMALIDILNNLAENIVIIVDP